MLTHTYSSTIPSPRYTTALLLLKLAAPPIRRGITLRPELRAMLSDVRLQPLTLITAPAGYGKTTLLSTWVADLQRTGTPVAWLSVEATERDPGVFLMYLISALQTILPALGIEAQRLLSSTPNPDVDWPIAAGNLSAELQRVVQTTTFLVLDDIHTIADSAVMSRVLGYLLRTAPPSLRILLASRRPLSFAPLSRMRAEGQVLELTQTDLHLSADQVARVLHEQGVTLADTALTALVERTEGWPLSVQLAARALASQPSHRHAGFIHALGGGQQQMFNYLATEVLQELPAEMTSFLHLAAIPPWFDAELLSAVMDADDARYLLGRAQTLGLPITPADEAGERLRFHPLWRDMLRRNVDMAASSWAERRQQLAQALLKQGALDTALQLYTDAGATTQLASTLRDHADALLGGAHRDMLRHWLDALNQEQIDGDPTLLHLWGTSQSISAPDTALDALDRAALRYVQQGDHIHALHLFADMLIILLDRFRSGMLHGICRRAVQEARMCRTPWARGAMRVAVAAMLLVRGREQPALRVASQAAAEPLTPTWRWLLAYIIGTAAVHLGQPHTALAHLDDALRIPGIEQDDRRRQNLLRLRAVALFQLGRSAEALPLIDACHRHLRDYQQHGGAGLAAMHHAMMLSSSERYDEAAVALSAARTAFHGLGEGAPLIWVQAIDLYIQTLRGHAPHSLAATSLARRMAEYGTSAGDLHMQFLLALALGQSDHIQQALTTIEHALPDMQRNGGGLFAGCAHLYAAYLQRGTDCAFQHIQYGWEMIASGGYIFLPFLADDVIEYTTILALRRGCFTTTAGRVLVKHLPERAPALLGELCTDPESSLRSTAVRMLGELGDPNVYVTVRAMLKDRDASVRHAAQTVLDRMTYRPPYRLRIRTLGGFGVWRGDAEVREREWRSSKARQLFQILLTERGRFLAREQLIEMLWPGQDKESTLNNLRVTFNRMSRAIEPDRPEGTPTVYVSQQTDMFTFNTTADYDLDAIAFASAVAAGQHALRENRRDAAKQALQQAIDLYGGPFLPDSLYEDWTAVERQRLEMLFIDAATSLAWLLLDERRAHEAIGLAWRVLGYDRTSEDAYRILMQAHMSLGERNAGLRVYQQCVTALRDEFGVEPLPETQELYERLRI